MGRKVRQPTPFSDVGKRLKAARLGLGYRVLEAYARKAGISSNHYSQHETGARLITLERAKALKKAFRLPLDFIYDGDLDLIPYGLAKKIEEILPTL